MKNSGPFKRVWPVLGLELLVASFMGSVALAASLTGMAVILFPELAALSHDVLIRPRGKWASEPLKLIVAPTLTAAFGLFCTRHLPYAVWNILLIVIVSLVIIRVLRSSMSPAISAGVLPLVLNEHSWFYVLAIFLDLCSLVFILLIRRQYLARVEAPSLNESSGSQVTDRLEETPRSRFWWLALITFITLVGAAAQYTHLRFLLFPPLIVMSYELFGHAEVPGWMKRPTLLPFVCLTTAAVGVVAQYSIHPTAVAVIVTVLFTVALLRLFDLHMPPALAIGVIPFVIERPGYLYALSVFVGSVFLSLSYRGFRRLQGLRAGSGE